MLALETKTMAIRALNVKDLPLCVPFGHAFIEEKHLPGPFNPEVFLKNWTFFLTKYPSVIFGLWKDGELIGAIGGMISPDLNTGQLLAVEFFWYVGQAHRGAPGSIKLVRRFKSWGEENGASRWKMIHLLDEGETPSDVRLGRVYAKLGLTPSEVGFDGEL